MFSVLILILITAHNLESALVKNNGHLDPVKLQHGDLSSKAGDDGVDESCKDLLYCTVKPPDYPEEKYNEMFKDNDLPPLMLPAIDSLENRIGDMSSQDDCEVEVTFEPLFKARTSKQAPWQFVIQAPNTGYVQQVRSEICKAANEPNSCFKPFLPLPFYETYCEQKYSSFEVLVESLNGNGTEFLKAIIPSCCSCKYKYVNARLI